MFQKNTAQNDRATQTLPNKWECLAVNRSDFIHCLSVLVSCKYQFSTVSICLNIRDRGRRGCDRMVVGFTATYAVSAYHH